MTTTSSDKPNLRHGSISSVPAPDVQHPPQQKRHVRSRLSIIPLPCRDEPVQRTSRKSRTSFSASSFSHRTSTPSDLQVFSHPLNPQEIHDLAVTSLEPPRSQLRDVTAPADTASGGTNVTPKPKFMSLSNGLYLPFVDRQSEVASLLQHPANISTLTLIELAFPNETQLSDFRRLLFDVPREEVDDVKWISTIRAILKPRSEILWARLKTIIGVPPELDADDYQLKAFLFGRSLSNLPENATAQWAPSDQSLAHSLTAPPSKQGTQSPSTTSPIIEEVESTDSNVSGQDQDLDFDSIHALCFQTAPSFIPCTDSTPSEDAPKSSMGTIGDSNVKQPQRIKDHNRDLEPSQISEVSSPSSGSTGSNTSLARGIRFASLRRPSAQHDHDMLRPTIKGITQRGRSPLSQSVTNSAEDVKGGDKKSEEGHESDVSGASSASLDREKKESVEEGSQIMTGTGDVTRPRKPSLRSDKTSDVPSRDLPPSTPTSGAICRGGENSQGGESRLDQSPKTPTSKATPHRTRRPSTSSRIQSPSLSTISLSEDAFSDHPITSSSVMKGRPRFPASFSKSPIARKPRAVSARHSGQATDTGSAKQRTTDHPRSRTVSSVPTQPQQTNVRLSPKPPPPTPETPGTSSSSTTAENVRPRRAMSLIQRRPQLSHQSSKGEEKEGEDGSKSSVEVEGLKDGVRGTKNPLFGA